MNRCSRRIGGRFFGLVLVALLPISCASVVEPTDSLTPAQLNASKIEYDGKRVKVHGWMRSEFENRGLWQSKKANGRGTYSQDCVSLLIPKSMSTEQYNKHYVEVEGIFIRQLPRNIVDLGGCNLTSLQLVEDLPPILIGKTD